tara:strand:- start:319 stop:810 length:492 start_codon:yes stop_codon:yes gene_type:complete
MDRKLTDPNNYIPNGWFKLPNGKLARKSDTNQENPMVTNYKSLLNKSKQEFKDIKIRQSKPELLEKDYKVGSIKRYFIQKSNDKESPIYEVNRRESSKYSRSTRYNLAVIDWVISGGDNYKITDDVTQVLTPEQMNQLSIANVSNIMPNLKLYLPNLLQFYKR